jgi:hypothetical protein
LTFNPNSLSSLGYVAYIEPSDSGYCLTRLAAGYYDPALGRLVLCMDRTAGLDLNYVKILAHEYFHATQFGYVPVFADWNTGKQEDWIIEGMAESAMESYLVDEMHRSPVGSWVHLHDVDIPLPDPGLSAEFYEYFAQDVANALGSGDHLELYWLWAKNQAMEATINFDGALTSPCVHEGNVVMQLQQFNYVFGSTSYYTFTLKPLQSALIKINFDHNYQFADIHGYALNFSDPNAASSMRYKLYRDGEIACDQEPDEERTFLNVTTTDGYYAMVSNVYVDETFDYLIGIETSDPSHLSH